MMRSIRFVTNPLLPDELFEFVLHLGLFLLNTRIRFLLEFGLLAFEFLLGLCPDFFQFGIEAFFTNFDAGTLD